MTGKHTKAPWVIFKAGIGEENGDGIASLWREGEEREANAALIVRAVNAHEALVRALEEIAEGAGPFSRDPLTHAENCIDDMKERARAALALARGETP